MVKEGWLPVKEYSDRLGSKPTWKGKGIDGTISASILSKMILFICPELSTKTGG
jgi:hypothetical protein